MGKGYFTLAFVSHSKRTAFQMGLHWLSYPQAFQMGLKTPANTKKIRTNDGWGGLVPFAPLDSQT